MKKIILKTSAIIILILSLFFIHTSLNITHLKANDIQPAVVDEEYLSRPSIYFPVAKINKLKDLENLNDYSFIPPNTLLYVDKEMNLRDQVGNTLEISLINAYSTYFCGEKASIPCVYLQNLDIAIAFIHTYNDLLKNKEIAVVGPFDVLTYVKKELPFLRAIIDFSKTSLSIEEFNNLAEVANKAYANTIILSKEQATKDHVTYLQSRLKMVWIDNDEITSFTALSELTTGAYGIITTSIDNVFTAMNKIKESENPLIRPSFNIAHRGLPVINYENSLEGCIDAINKGATHIELDGQVTKDGHIVIMHDTTLDRTTNATGKVKDYTLEQLEKVRITKNIRGTILGKGVKIPTLEEVFELVKNTNVVLVLEIKNSDTRFVPILKDLLNQYDISNNLVVISFTKAQLAKMNELLPNIPLADLNNYSCQDFKNNLSTIYSNNYAIDTNLSNDNNNLSYILATRGFMNWYWTYDNETSVSSAIENGVVGITNNYANTFQNFYKSLNFEETYLLVSSYYEYINILNGDASVILNATKYDGYKTFVKANIFDVLDCSYCSNVIFCYDFTYNNKTYKIFSEPIRMVIKNDFLEVEKLNEILKKEISDLTEEEKKLLNNGLKYYEIYLKSDQEKIDITLLKKKMVELRETYKETYPLSCKNSANLLLSIPVLSIFCYLILKKRDYFM